MFYWILNPEKVMGAPNFEFGDGVGDMLPQNLAP